MADVHQSLTEMVADGAIIDQTMDVNDDGGIIHQSLTEKTMSIDSHCEMLTTPITGAEIKEAMLSIPGNKAPGPDGYNSQFFKDNWELVGGEVIAAVQNVINSGKLLKQCNNTIITLVPKVVVPDTVLQFRPIACCNTVYNCLSKVLFNRIGKVLPDIISPSQGAFIKGRDIVGNILICQDLIKLYKRKSCSPRAMMKIDLQKAYDSVEIQLSHLCFADDLLLFCKRERGSIGLMMKAFDVFSKATGLVMSRSKSSLYCNGMDKQIIRDVEQNTGMKRGTVPFTYLGVTVSPKRLSVLDCQCLIEKDQICQPRKQGGLGVKDLHVWNIATVGKYVWWIANKEDHLRVRWVYAVYIKTSSWWEYEPGTGCSWAWRKICQVKKTLKPYLLSIPSLEHYSITAGYQWIKPDGAVVPWYPWMLNEWIIPKQKFICWLIAHQRLLTQDRLMRMGILQSNKCFLCGLREESLDHLFFACPLAANAIA
ncbi:uncharacterized protein LOC141589812 [Silene latifolia]|uniref:uncharacterized protein LOC141589812 n=1 Tax=Silene latifolia TaxID=37657 RepID=UPI003D779F46